jgi:GntR family transcriptional regulator
MLKIKLNSPVPIYVQVVNEITQMIHLGELKPGDELPSIRSLASQLSVSNNTVARAYLELERQHSIISNGRKGTFVRELKPESDTDYQKIFKESIIRLIRAGMDEKNIQRVFKQNLNEIFK